LIKVQDLENWKNEMITHESLNPLTLANEHFFLPLNQISITSIPTREQDVIALFNQLLAGGVIRNIKVMATNERFTYDGLYKIVITPPFDNHIYNKENNPLGVFAENIKGVLEKYPDGFLSSPRVLEYKFTLDGLIEDIADGSKNTNDIGLVVAWNAGELYKQNYYISSLLIDDNICMRQYHGITHIMCDLISKEKVCDLILLEDLIQYLNNPIECITSQLVYDEQ